MSKDNECRACSAFVIGALVGAIAGIVLAPKKGKETRKDLKKWVDTAVEENKDKLDDIQEFGGKVNKFGDNLKTHADKLAQTIKEHKERILPSKPQE